MSCAKCVVALVGVAAAAVLVAAADRDVVVAGDRHRTPCSTQQRPDRVALGAEAAEVAEAVQLVAAARARVVQPARAARRGWRTRRRRPRSASSVRSIVRRQRRIEITRGSFMPRIAILGAGPIGLEAALAAAERGDDFTVYEAAPTVGGHVRRWGHVRTFTPWAMNVSPRMRAALAAGARRRRAADRRRARRRAARAGRRAARARAGASASRTRVLAVGARGAAQARGDRRPATRARARFACWSRGPTAARRSSTPTS